MAAMACTSMTLRAPIAPRVAAPRALAARGSPVLPVRSLRARTVRLAGSRQNLQVRAATQGPNSKGTGADTESDLDRYLAQYKAISYKIPPVVTACTLPVLLLSVLSKTITGHGLPGDFLGTIEGFSYLLFLAGAGSLLPRLSAIVAGGNYEVQELIDVLTAPEDGAMGADATARVYGAKVAKGSALAEQMDDLKKRKAEKDAETPEQTAARIALNAKLTATVLNNAKESQDGYNDEKGSDEKLLKKSATETISECMTTENFDKNIKDFKDEDLNNDINLTSTSGIESKAPATEGKGDDWRKKNFEAAEARSGKSESN